MSFFAVYRADGRREYWSLQAVIYICFQILFMWQEIHQGKCETHVLLFTAISHMSDQSMLVFCFRGHTFVVYLRTTEVHNNSVFKELTLLFLLQKSHLWNPTCEIRFPIVNTPHSCRIPVQRTPLPFGNPKSRLWYRYEYFLELPITTEFGVHCMSLIKVTSQLSIMKMATPLAPHPLLLTPHPCYDLQGVSKL